MKFILEYKKYFQEGDKVLIEYFYNDMVTCVLVKDMVGQKYLVSHNVPESKIQNAPDEFIKKSDVISVFRKDSQ